MLVITSLHRRFSGIFSTTVWVSRYRKGKTSLDLNEARDDGVWRWQWHQLDHMQTICTLLQTDNHTNTSSVSSVTHKGGSIIGQKEQLSGNGDGEADSRVMSTQAGTYLLT